MEIDIERAKELIAHVKKSTRAGRAIDPVKGNDHRRNAAPATEEGHTAPELPQQDAGGRNIRKKARRNGAGLLF